MNTPQNIDRLGLAIARLLGQQPEVSEGVAARLASARQVAVSRARGTAAVRSNLFALACQYLARMLPSKGFPG